MQRITKEEIDPDQRLQQKIFNLKLDSSRTGTEIYKDGRHHETSFDTLGTFDHLLREKIRLSSRRQTNEESKDDSIVEQEIVQINRNLNSFTLE
jgi:hypothetical protein